MNIGLLVVLAGLGWMFVAVLVSVAVGGMAKARDVGTRPTFDHPLAAGRFVPPERDEAVRTAV